MALKAEEWGKIKFKPTLTRTTQNPFTKPQNFNRTDDNAGIKGRGGKYNGNNRGGGMRVSNHQRGRGKFIRGTSYVKNDRVKFNSIARDAKPDVATPWTKFKDEINYKQREEKHEALQACMNNEEAIHARKQREMKYRRFLMEQKKQETTQWEDFGLNEDNNGIKTKLKEVEQSIVFAQTGRDKKNKQKLKPVSKFIKGDVPNKGKGYYGNGNERQSNDEAHFLEKSKKYKSEKRLELQEDSVLSQKSVDSAGRKTKGKRKHDQQAKTGQPEIDTTNIKDKNTKKIKKQQKFKNGNGSKLEPKSFAENTLTFDEKDKIRKVITKCVTLQKGTSLTQRLKNRMYQNACKKKKTAN